MNADDSTNLSSSEWALELSELYAKRKLALALGGEANVRLQHEHGKLTARERISSLLDPGTFREMGMLAGVNTYREDGTWLHFQPANTVIGTGTITGRKVSVAADDFTIRGGSSESAVSEKWIYAERYALSMKMPLIRLVETAGGSVKLLEKKQSTKIPGYSTWPAVPLLRSCPVVGVAMGPCAGLGALKVMTSHFSIMVRGSSQVFAGGPPVVKQALDLDVDKEALGGYKVHSRNTGMVDNEAADEADALDQVRHFLSYLPSNARLLPPNGPTSEPADRADPWLRDAIPNDSRKLYDIRKILSAICDSKSIFEIGAYHGRSAITALARLNGHAVGIIANDPRFSGGAMTRLSSYKTSRFIELCDTFHLPIINFVDQPGNMVGPKAELDGTLFGAIQVLKAVESSTTPWMSVILRRAFGLAGGLHGRNHGGLDGRSLNHRVAWPSARWGSIPIQGGVQAAYKREIAAAADPLARRRELEAYYEHLASPFRTAANFGIVDIIDPIESRAVVCSWVVDAYQQLKAQL